MAQMNLTPLDDVLDKHFGKVGTPKRDAFESDVDEALHAYRLGEAIKKARIEQNLTQEQLGERIGVKRAQISAHPTNPVGRYADANPKLLPNDT